MSAPGHPFSSAFVAAAALLLAALGACDGGQVAEPEAALEIVPDSVTLTHIGERSTFTVQGGAGAVRWSSLDEAVFEVDATGTVTARGNGVSRLLASDENSVDNALVQVRQAASELEAFGDGQRAAPALALLEPVGVRVRDAGGTPVSRAFVWFRPQAGSGRVDPEMALTDSLGLVSTMWTLGRRPGRQTLRAVTAEDGPSVEIAATALEPDEAVNGIAAWSGQDQWELPGHVLPEPVVVRVVDEARRPVWGATVRFEPEAGDGRAEPAEAVTDSLGLASATWILGERQGEQRLLARAGEVTVVFDASAASDEGVCYRTPQVSAAIAREARVETCAEVTVEHLQRLDWLDLSNQHIARLRSGDFDGLVALQGLHLNYNELAELPPDVFDGLTRLRTLTLLRNQLTALPADLLASLTRLEDLGLGSNRLSELPPGIFTRLSRLRDLDLGNNELSRLAPGVFENLSSLEALNLGGNRLMELTPEMLSELKALRVLRFSNNELSALAEDIVNGLSNLELLTMRGNQLTSLPPGIFSGLTRLEYLAVGANRLTSLPPGLLSETPALGTFRFDGNELTALPPDLFSQTPALERVYLQENRLRELPSGIFDGLPSLFRLDLSRNYLGALPPGVFDGVPSLAWLDLDRNFLEELPPGVFSGTPKLAELTLDWNSLADLPRGVFAGLSELEWVSLANNPGAPFAVKPELVRADAADPLAAGPATVVARVPMGAPFGFDFPVSVQRGTISRAFVSMLPGDTVSAPFVVEGTVAGAAAHVGFGQPPEVTGVGYGGLDLVRGEELALFAATDNRSPVARSRVRAHRMQVGGPSALTGIGEYFDDPDGDSLVYEVATTVPGVVDARIEEGVLRLDPMSVDTTEVEVTATDPGGLRATQRFLTWVVPAPDPGAFDIELYFEPGFTPEEEATIRRAADRWMEVVTGDLPDVPVQGPLGEYCNDSWGPRLVGVVDDALIRMKLFPYLENAVASAGICGRRAGSELDFLGRNNFNQWYFRHGDLEYLYEVALHEIGHVLGIGFWSADWVRDRETDPHFTGPLAVAAFDAAGGEGYSGGKVPLADQRTLGGSASATHWRRRVIPDDVMAVGRGNVLVTAIALQALADLGHEVDLSRADPYTLPAHVQGDVAGGAAAEETADAALLVFDDVIEGQVVVVDEDGKVVRVIRP